MLDFYMQWEEFWWSNITGPRTLVAKVAQLLAEKNTVLLHVPSDLPWRQQMRNHVLDLFRRTSESDNVIIRLIDACDDYALHQEPGRFLLEEYADPTVQNGYRARGGFSLQDYIQQQAVLKDSVVWVKGLDAARAKEWLQFCKGYHAETLKDGVFVLEMQDEPITLDTKRIKTVSFEKQVSKYDVQLFSSFILNEGQTYSADWKRYIASLVANLCDWDAEIAELVLRMTDFRHEEPDPVLEEIAALPDFSRRGADESHILAFTRREDKAELERRIWAAQLEVLFPVIEAQRLEIIDLLEGPLYECLQTCGIRQYGETLQNPRDMELGTLCYLMAHRRPNGFFELYVPNEELRARILFLRECRNKLAHGNRCTPAEIELLLCGSAGVEE